MIMNVLFLGCLYSEDKISTYLNNSKRGYQFAAQNLQSSIIDGFDCNNVNLTVLTIPSLSSFPRSYKKPIVKGGDFIFRGKKRGRSIGYLNLPLFRVLTDNYFSCVNKWYYSHEGIKHVFVYGIHKQIMDIALKAKRLYPDLTLTIIVPDLPQFFGWNKYYKRFGLDKTIPLKLVSQARCFDKFVLLNEHMKEFLFENGDNSYIVVEGIYSPDIEIKQKVAPDKKIILYTGNISARYGVKNLLTAFSLIRGNEYELWIRGDGDLKELVLQSCNADKRIHYIEPLPKINLYRIQQEAMILVNPVSPREEFTRYFFPSKTMDYLASGTPVLMFNLDCLPKEYKDYLYFFESEDPRSMAKDIERICNKPSEELLDFGLRAQGFVLSDKNPQVQVSKIIQLMNE